MTNNEGNFLWHHVIMTQSLTIHFGILHIHTRSWTMIIIIGLHNQFDSDPFWNLAFFVAPQMQKEHDWNIRIHLIQRNLPPDVAEIGNRACTKCRQIDVFFKTSSPTWNSIVKAGKWRNSPRRSPLVSPSSSWCNCRGIWAHFRQTIVAIAAFF